MIRTILTVKGGVGKTTTAINLGAGLAHAGKKTLLIDFDGQGTLSKIMLQDNVPEKTITDVMAGTESIRNCIVPSGIPNLDLVPANIYLFSVERQMLISTTGVQQFHLRKALKEVRDYDEIIIDNNPSLNMCSTNSICACNQIIIPAIPDHGSEAGIELTLNHCREILDQIDDVEFDYRILINCMQRNNKDKEALQRIKDRFGAQHIYKQIIRFQGKPMKEAGYTNGIVIDDKNAPVAEEFRSFISEVIQEEETWD